MTMTVTRDVIADLLPLYMSGEASADTRTLVDEFLAEDPELAAIVRSDAGETIELDVPRPLSPDIEMRALRKTKELMTRRDIFLAFAMFFTGMPAAVRGDETGVYWLWADAPQGAILMAAIAVFGWVGYLTTRRRLRDTGI